MPQGDPVDHLVKVTDAGPLGRPPHVGFSDDIDHPLVGRQIIGRRICSSALPVVIELSVDAVTVASMADFRQQTRSSTR
jgi:hypothetical protein